MREGQNDEGVKLLYYELERQYMLWVKMKPGLVKMSEGKDEGGGGETSIIGKSYRGFNCHLLNSLIYKWNLIA